MQEEQRNKESKMEFRQAELKDLADVAKLITIEFAGEIANEMPYLKEDGNPNKFLEIWNQMLSRNTHNIFVCYQGDNLLGAIGGYCITQSYSDHPIYGVEDFWYIKKQHRHNGIGIKLYNLFENWLKEINVDKIQMMHYPFAPRLKNFYESKGYEVLETTYVKSLKAVQDAVFEDPVESDSMLESEMSLNGELEE